MAVIAGALAPFRDHWAVQAAILLWALTAPGRLALAAIRMRPIQISRGLIYVIALSLLFLMVVGATVNGIGTLYGDDHPLRASTLWTGFIFGYLIVLAAAGAAPHHLRPSVGPPPASYSYLPLALPAFAAAGALRLNNGHGSALALATMVAVAALWLVRPFLPGFSWRTASIAIYAITLAACLSFSLRGDSVYGFDIVTEYNVALQTHVDAVWHLKHPNDAYGALLSVTVLPASLSSISGAGILVIFKVVMPALFAFVPVGLLRVAGRLLPLRWAYVATGIVVGQQFFLAGIPAVARQEIAFIFLVSFVCALIDARGKPAIALLIACALGIVISHYSTAYMAAVVMGVATLVGVVIRLRRRATPLLGVALGFTFLAAGSILWYGVLTDSASNVSVAFDNLRANGINFLPNRSGGVLSTLINGNVTSSMSVQQYAPQVAARYAKLYGYITPARDAGAFPLKAATPLPGTGTFGAVGSTVVLVVSQIVNVLAVVGALIMALGRRSRPIHRILGVIAVGTLVFLVLVRVSGTLAQSYNLERAQLQGFFVLAPIAVWTGLQVPRLFRRSASRHAMVKPPGFRRSAFLGLAATALFIANAIGLVADSPTKAGRANLSNSGEDAARFVYREPDLAGARWLGRANPKLTQLTYSDAYGKLRLFLVNGGNRSVFADVTPRTLNRQAWIFAYSQNSLRPMVARSTFDGRPVLYAFPSQFVTAKYDRVYANGTSEVFHR